MSSQLPLPAILTYLFSGVKLIKIFRGLLLICVNARIVKIYQWPYGIGVVLRVKYFTNNIEEITAFTNNLFAIQSLEAALGFFCTAFW